MTRTEFLNASAAICGRMLSTDKSTRTSAPAEASALLGGLSKQLLNDPANATEIDALRTLIKATGEQA